MQAFNSAPIVSGPDDQTPGIIFGDSQCEKFYEMQPQEKAGQGQTWYARGQNFIVAWSEAKPGAIFERKDQPDEYVVVISDPLVSIEVKSGKDSITIPGYSLTIVPPGNSAVIMPTGGRLLRVFTAESEDLASKCSNASSYINRHPNLPPFEPWPKPNNGYRVRSYSLDVPSDSKRVGRIFVCSTLMINYANTRKGRSNGILSPHSHEDFEQGTLVIEGTVTHHLRWPWTRQKATWREDEHDFCRAPSLHVVPANVIHTAEAVGDGNNQLVDIWCPPRPDYFQLGFALNANEYCVPPKK